MKLTHDEALKKLKKTMTAIILSGITLPPKM